LERAAARRQAGLDRVGESLGLVQHDEVARVVDPLQSHARQGRVGVGIGLVDHRRRRAHGRVVGIEQRGRRLDRGQVAAGVGGQKVVQGAADDRLGRGLGPLQRQLLALGRLDHARQGHGLLAAEGFRAHGHHTVAHDDGSWLDVLDRGGRREQRREERQAVDDHQAADVLGMAAGQQQAGETAHRVTDHRR
jgi:hypothetical protein